jgi:hypothetical protein
MTHSVHVVIAGPGLHGTLSACPSVYLGLLARHDDDHRNKEYQTAYDGKPIA